MAVKQVFNTSAELDFPNVLPTLDLDFANSKTLDPRIDFTRASGGSYVGADGLIKYAGVNEARFDHDPSSGESLGLLIEESRTSLTLSSETFGSGFRNIVLTNQATAPDGNLSASIIEANESSASGAAVLKTFAATTNTFTVSVFAKSLTTSTLWLRPQNPTIFSERAEAYFDLSNGNIGNVTSDGGVFINPSASIQKFNGGWYRCSLTFTLTTSAFTGNTRFYVVNSLNSSNVTKGASIYLWGAQLEVGAFPTSYIPTQASTRTRAADNASITGKNFSEWYRQDEGTVLVNLSKRVPFHTDYINPRTGLVAITQAMFRGIYIDYRKDAIRVDGTSRNSATSFLAAIINTSSKSPNILKSALSYSIINSTFSFISNLSQNVNSQTLSPTVNKDLFIGRSVASGTGSGSQYTNGTISRLTYFPKRLPNAQLQALTS
jgi:hypothetical protein